MDRQTQSVRLAQRHGWYIIGYTPTGAVVMQRSSMGGPFQIVVYGSGRVASQY